MSFSLAKEDEESKRQVSTMIESMRKRVRFLAAASNAGKNAGRTFPAKHSDVCCVYATDGQGSLAGLNPNPVLRDANICTLGLHVMAPHKGLTRSRESGTSVATAVTAGIAALVLEFARQDPVPGQRSIKNLDTLVTKDGMLKVFELMHKRSEGSESSQYLHLRPWLLLSTELNSGDEMEAWRDIAADIDRELQK